MEISDEDKQQWNEMIAQDTLKGLKVDALKAICKALSVPVSGKKDELMGRIVEAMGKL